MALSDDLDVSADEARALESDVMLLAAGNAAKAALLVERDTTIAQLLADLAECDDPPPPPPPPVVKTLWGMGSFSPVNTSPELDAYRGKSRLQVFQTVDNEMNALVPGARMGAIRVYNGGLPSSYSAHDASWVPAPVAPVASLKGSDASMASGSLDAQVRAFIQSWPVGRKGYLLWNHERDNDPDALANPSAIMATHNRAIGRFAARVLAERGSKDITPGCCPTGWNLQDQNNSYPRDVLNCRAELVNAGVDLDDFIYMVDSYQRGTAEPNGFSRVTSPIFRRLRGWGFPRVGLGEVSVDSYGTATRALADDYIRNMDAEVDAHDVEVVCWYESGGGNSAPAQGWWLFGTEVKRAWATAVAGG